MTVTDILARRLPHLTLPAIDQPQALVAICTRWDEIADLLTVGDGKLDQDEAQECLQHMASALVHPHARPTLILSLPQLQHLTRQMSQVLCGDLDPTEIGCGSLEEARVLLDSQIDQALWPLTTGLPIVDACRDCIQHCAGVQHWQPRLTCSTHRVTP